ncbi:hypothetical protein D3C76_1510420 [compost metagenome]
MRGVTQALHGNTRGLINEIPGRIAAFTPSPQHHNGVCLLGQARPLFMTQGRLGFQHTR